MYDDGILNANFSSSNIGSQFVVGGNSWASNTITYYFKSFTNDIPGVTSEKNAIRDAFALWSEYSPLTFIEGSSAANSDIVISWEIGSHGDGHPFDNGGTTNSNVLAHAYQPPSNGTSHDLSGDIHFDDYEMWTTSYRNSNSSPFDLITVAAHEIGHALGLNHSSVSNSLMSPTYMGSHRYLCLDDILGIQNIYGSKINRTAFNGPNTICNTNNHSYYLEGICDFSNVSYTASSNIQIVSSNGNQVIIKKLSNGNGWIKATISGVVILKNIELGKPTLSLWVGGTGPYGQVDAIVTGGKPNYTWQKNGTTILISSANSVTLPFGCDGGLLKVSSSNSCGTSYTSQIIQAGCYSNNYYSTIFPNPVAAVLTVKESIDYMNDLNKEIEESVFNENLELYIYNQENFIVFKQNTAGQKEININLKHLKEGWYYLVVQGPNFKETHKFFKE